MAVTQQYRELAVGTPLGADVLLLRGMTYSEELGRPFAMSLDLLSESPSISFDDIVGQNVTVRLETPSEALPTRYFNGYVSAFTRVGTVGGYFSYRAEVVPWIWFLTRTSDCRIFQNLTVPDIIQQVFRDQGMDDFEVRIEGTHQPWEYCVQYRETDYHFVTRLMEQEGIYYYVRHENGRHFLVLADSLNAHEPLGGYAELPVLNEERMRTAQDMEYVYGVSLTCQVQPGAYAHTDYDFENPKKNLQARSQIPRPHAASTFEIYDYPGEYREFGDGETAARWRVEEMQARHWGLSAQSNARGIAAGHKLQLLSDCLPENVECLITAVHIDAAVDVFESSGAAKGGGRRFRCSFSAMKADEQFRLPRTTAKPVIPGAQTAIVVGKSGEEIWTDEYGRVKVQFHWDRYSGGDENSSCWVRVAQTWAGKKWGAVHIPRIGQEVIVEFLEGDPDRPIITGRVYNADCMPPYELPTYGTMSTVKSSSSKGGSGFNEIRFEDKAGEENLFIHAQKSQDNRVKGDSREFVGNHRHLIVKGDQREKVDGKLGVTVGDSHDEKVSMKYALDAGQEIHLKAGTKLILEAGVQISLKVGGNFIDIGPAGVSITGTMVNINSGGSGGSGSGASPEEPEEALTADPGEVSQASGRSHQKAPVDLGSAEVESMKTSWIEIELKDDEGNPVPGERFKVVSKDGVELDGQTDEEGKARVAGLEAGDADIRFPDMDNDEWDRG